MAEANCTAHQVKGVVQRFQHAFNVGDFATLEHLWAPEGQGFDWYTTDAPGERVRGAAKDRASLIAYFRDRHSHGETLRITWYRFNGISAEYGNFEFRLTRTARDLHPTAYVGKGAVICDSALIRLGVWSMARNPQA